MSRGLPTIPSLFVERVLLGEAIALGLAQEVETRGSIRFVLPQDLPQDKESDVDAWQYALIRAHVAVDPRLTSDCFDLNIMDSEEERRFFCQVIPQAVRAGVWQWFEPQKPFAELLPPEYAAMHFDQRVDFALAIPGVRAVVEVDGSQHERSVQAVADRRRDASLEQQGWQTRRIPTRQLYDASAHAQVAELAVGSAFCDFARYNCLKPLWQHPLDRCALRLVLAPFGIARLQSALLRAIEDSVLSLRQATWRLVIVERDVPCALLALVDFRMQLEALCSLLKLDWQLPKMEVAVYCTSEFASFGSSISEAVLNQHGIQARQAVMDGAVPNGDRRADLLLDVSVWQRDGYNRTEARWIDQHVSAQGAAYEIRSSFSSCDARRVSALDPIAYPVDDSSLPALKYFLQNIFRKNDFRDGQFSILRRALALKPVIGLLPTGAGKSLCYQLAALLQPGMTIVIDPIVSLMVDQIDNLKTNSAIDWVSSISSWQDAEDKTAVQAAMGNGKVKILFVSPERLQSEAFRNKLREYAIAYAAPYAVIDEAHCVSEWGHDFRTSYLRLADTLREYAQHCGKGPTVLALTGTASYSVLSDVQREIGVDEEEAQVYPKSFDREELHFYVIQSASDQKPLELYALLQSRLPQYFQESDWQALYLRRDGVTKAGIVFTPHAKGEFGANYISTLLSQKLNTGVGSFTGQDGKEEKSQVQSDFKNNKFPLLVATKSFGMGIDKSNIRYTVHYNIPPSLEAFYQEAGRAGRDRNPAACWLLFSDDDPSDTDLALAPEAEDAVLERTANGHGSSDVRRLLWLHRNSFQGPTKEMDAIRTLYKEFVAPRLKGQPIGKPVKIEIPFGVSNSGHDATQKERDKALYRLRILGLVLDYTFDYNGKVFAVNACVQTEDQLLVNLQRYIGRYKVQEVVDAIPSLVAQEPGATMLGKCAAYLLRFVYAEIEKKRRAAIRSMVEVARKAASYSDLEEQDNYVRGELRAYLEKSPFTDALLELALQTEPKQWFSVLEMRDTNGISLLSTVDGVRQLVGGCRRMLESYVEHPGLLFLSSVGRLLMPSPDTQLATDEERRAIRALSSNSPEQREQIIGQMLDGYKVVLRNAPHGKQLYEAAVSVALEENPTRSLVRRVWPAAQPQATRVLLTLLLHELRAVNHRLLGKD